MKIRSKFKDYYDYVGQRYGEDPEVVYARGTIDTSKFEFPKMPRYGAWLRQRVSEPDKTLYETELLVAGDMVFPVVRMTYYAYLSGAVLDVKYRLLDPRTLLWLDGSAWRWNLETGEERCWAQFSEWLEKYKRTTLDQAQRDLSVPVFLVGAQGVYERTPVLKDFGISALVTPEQMWQNIYSCITNRIRQNPDRETPVEVSNDSKIAKAGFDKKTSFRHPVKLSKLK